MSDCNALHYTTLQYTAVQLIGNRSQISNSLEIFSCSQHISDVSQSLLAGCFFHSATPAFPFTHTLGQPSLGLRIIPIAEPLYERWDAHVGGVSTYAENDCCHWCNPSGVLSFIHHRIHSAIASVVLPAPPALSSAVRHDNVIREHFIMNKHLMAHLKQYEQLVEVTEADLKKRYACLCLSTRETFHIHRLII